MTGSFVEEPPVSAHVQALYDEDLADGGYVWNVSRLWAHQPGTLKQLFGLMSEAFTPSGLTFRQRGILVSVPPGLDIDRVPVLAERPLQQDRHLRGVLDDWQAHRCASHAVRPRT
jgi:hypothetical protein